MKKQSDPQISVIPRGGKTFQWEENLSKRVQGKEGTKCVRSLKSGCRIISQTRSTKRKRREVTKKRRGKKDFNDVGSRK